MPGMGRHGQVRAGRPDVPVARLRYSRLCAAFGSAMITLVAVLGAVGLLPTSSAPGATATATLTAATPAADVDTRSHSRTSPRVAPPTAAVRGEHATAKQPQATLPANSGSGRRIVFAMGAQRVWLVSADDQVR